MSRMNVKAALRVKACRLVNEAVDNIPPYVFQHTTKIFVLIGRRQSSRRQG